MSSEKVTLALGGGGARGVAHLGAIEILLDAEFSIERIVGVSIGSLAGAIYAFEPDIEKAQQRTREYLLSERFRHHQQVLLETAITHSDESSGALFSWYETVKLYLRANQRFHRVATRPALLPGFVLRDVVDSLLPDADIADAKIPLTIVAVDLKSGHNVLLEKGPVRDAVRASSSLPGIWPPVTIDDMLLCDVGVFYSVPTTLARAYSPHCLVAIDVSSSLRPLTKCETAMDVMVRMDEIAESMFRKEVIDAADVIIHPEVADIEWFDFSSPDALIEAGRKAARQSLARLRDYCK